MIVLLPGSEISRVDSTNKIGCHCRESLDVLNRLRSANESLQSAAAWAKEREEL